MQGKIWVISGTAVLVLVGGGLALMDQLDQPLSTIPGRIMHGTLAEQVAAGESMGILGICSLIAIGCIGYGIYRLRARNVLDDLGRNIRDDLGDVPHIPDVPALPDAKISREDWLRGVGSLLLQQPELSADLVSYIIKPYAEFGCRGGGIPELQTAEVIETIDKFVEAVRIYEDGDYTRRLLAGERLKAFIYGRALPDIEYIKTRARGVSARYTGDLDYDTYFFFANECNLESSECDEARIYNLFFTPQTWSQRGIDLNPMPLRDYLSRVPERRIEYATSVKMIQILNTVERHVNPKPVVNTSSLGA